MTEEQTEQLLSDITILKRIKVLELMERGYSQADVAKILETSQSSVSRIFPPGFKVKNG